MSSAVLVGSPNSGKSLLFNRLTGLNQKVANFPGITVDVTEGRLLADGDVRVLDFPGTYSLHPISGEERIAVDNFRRLLEEADLGAVLCIIDATRLSKSLSFALQVVRECQRAGKRVVILANMMDVLERHGVAFDAAGLASELDVPVMPMSGRTGQGVREIEGLLARLREAEAHPSAGRLAELDDASLVSLAGDLRRRFGARDEILVANQTRIDGFFLHSTFGGLAFAAIMYVLFQSIFTWAAPAMDGVEAGIGALAEIVVPLLPAGAVSDFVADALFGGIGAFLVFVPQIFVLTFIVGIMEDSGYMARAAVICHRPLRAFGLTGKSFVPMLSGVACAIPAIYAARAIDSPRRRFLTYLAIPLMPCSARLPVYTLLIAVLVPAQTALGGLVGLQGLALFVMYFFGLLVGLLTSALVARLTRRQASDDMPFVLEMPPYRLPAWRSLLRHSWDRCAHFVKKAGAVIFGVTVTVWVLGYFPNGGEDLGASWLGGVGQFIEPLFAPLDLDWRYAVALLSAFLAREVFVGTLGTLFGIEGADENFVPLAEQVQASGLSLASGVALLVIFAVALQCVSTVATLRGETGSWKVPVQMLVAYGALAYVLALVAYWIVAALGGA
ncbi:MAG: ferrous iron transporter B [Pseudomonadales bacterium]|jgi:ferrous iron transport protein B|nr:ferrous iron transporter B [Pseudomonadales bacterium]